MALKQQHIVKRQVVELQLSDAKGATEIPDRIAQWIKRDLPQLLDQLFSAKVPPDVCLSIDRLELDLGRIPVKNLEEILFQKVQTLLEEQLAHTVHQARHQVPGALGRWIPVTGGPRSDSAAPHSELDALIFYWQRGVLPWWLSANHGSIAELIQNAEQKNRKALVWAMLQSLGKNPSRSRVLATIEPPKIIEWILDYGKGASNTNQDDGAPLPNTDFTKSLVENLQLLQQYWPSFWKGTHFSATRKKQIQLALTDQLIDWLGTKQNKKVLDLIGFIRTGQAVKIQADITADFCQKVMAVLDNTHKSDLHKQTSKPLSLTKPTNDFTEEGFPVDQVGLVLFWPYLQLFFKELGLLQEGQFTDASAQEKAIQLLQFLCVGEESLEEPDLVLAKIICGLPIEDFVTTELDLNEDEKAECIHLIEVVIGNWKVLKNTSVNGFRKAFLNRQGILSKDNNGWLLQVERQAMDILLDRLTWPISVIKLPWNQYMINVKW